MMGALFFVISLVGILWLISILFHIAFALLIPIIFWMLAGMLAGRVLRGRGYGPVGDVLLGLGGGIVGSMALSVVGLGWLGNVWLVGSIVVGVFGAVLLVYAVRFFGNKDFAA